MKKIESIQDYQEEYRKSIENPEVFWAGVAEQFHWRKKWNKVLEWDFKKPEVKWFLGAKLNITENCLDRHLPAKANETAIIWEPNNPKDRALNITYQHLFEEVCKTANMLKAQGVGKGDRVCIYLPMIPELAYAILACARIGAVHSVVFAGFSSRSLVDRITDAGCKIAITSDGGFRGEKSINLKGIMDDALEKCPEVEKVIVVEHTRTKPVLKPGRDLWWHEEIKKVGSQCEAEEMDRFSGVRRILDGSPDTLTSCTARYQPEVRLSCLREFPPGRTGEDSGRQLSDTKSTYSIQPPLPSGRWKKRH